MRKWLTAIALLLLAVGIASATAETFTFFEGLPYGITEREADDLLMSKGFQTEGTAYGLNVGKKAKRRTQAGIEIEFLVTTIGGISGTGVHLGFSKEKGLYQQGYDFHYRAYEMGTINEYYQIEQVLEKKYGPTKYNLQNQMMLPEYFPNGKDFLGNFTRVLNYENEYRDTTTFNNIGLSQRIIEEEGGRKLLIEHYIYYHSPSWYCHQLYYTVLEPDVVSMIEDATASRDDNL